MNLLTSRFDLTQSRNGTRIIDDAGFRMRRVTGGWIIDSLSPYDVFGHVDVALPALVVGLSDGPHR